MHRFSDDQIAGATSLIRDGLRLSAGYTLLLLYQNILADAADCIREVAEAMGVHVDTREFSREDFQGQYPESFSAERLSRESPVPAGIALLIEWSEPTTRARLRFLRQLEGTGEPWRVASMPGVDLDGLSSCRSDFADIREKCLDLFAVLARGKSAILMTKRPDGAIDELKIPIGSFCPIMSTGEIGEGSWGNFPSGETFILPDVFRANGWVTLRGSFPDHVLRDTDWVRFEVRDGRLRSKSIQASSLELSEVFASYFFSQSGHPKSKNSNALAELGIGSNANIEVLSGKPIFDEKKIGTVHIAFGGNAQFNGPLDASIHHDLTCTGADLAIDRVRVLREGKYVLKKEDALPQLEKVTMREAPRGRSLSLGAAAFKFHASSEPTLEVEYVPYRGNSVYFIVAIGAVAQLANKILNFVGERGTASVSDLRQLWSNGLDDKLLGEIVGGMVYYKLIKFSR